MTDEWLQTTLGQVSSFASGYSFKPSEQGLSAGDIPFLKVSDMNLPGNEVRVTTGVNWVDAKALARLGAKSWPAGTVIFPKVGAALLTEKRRILGLRAAFDNNVMGLVADPKILLSDFLYALMCQVRLGDYAQQGAVPSVNQRHLSGISVHLPPLPVQRRIVDLMGHLDAHLANLEAERDATSGLLEALRRDLFATVESSPAITLGELTAQTRPICYGVLKPGPNDPDGVPLVRIVDMVGDTLANRGLHLISPDLDDEFRRSRLMGGEVLLSIQGTVGRVALVPPELSGANISRTIARIAPDSRLDPAYLRQWLMLIARAEGFDDAGSTRASLNIGTIRKMEVPVPTLETQRRVLSLLEASESTFVQLGQEVEHLRTLRRTVLTELLTRECVVPDTYDEFLGVA